MFNRIRMGLLKRIAREERGQIFIMVLALLVLGGLVIPPLLAFTGTGIKTGQVYEQNASELYAADAGIEDGIWQIKYYDMEYDPDHRFPGYEPYAYYEHDTDYSWTYDVSDQPGELNDEDVQVTVENEWIPKGIPVPSEYEANAIVSAANLIVTGSMIADNTYRIRISYTKAEMADDGPPINKIGVWLPPGFEYVPESSNLEQLNPSDDAYPDSVVVTSPYKGGEAVEWSFSSVLMTLFPGVDDGDQPLITEVTFQYTGSGGPTAVGWVKTGNYSYLPYGYSWDADTKIYKITSMAGATTLESYTTKSEIRHLGGAIAGDYYATGNSLLGGDPTYRDELHQSSSTTVAEGAIPESSQIEAAYLYWSGWIDYHGYVPPLGTGGDTTVFTDDCRDFYSPPVSWSYGSGWTISYGEFRGRGASSSSARTLTMSGNVNLSAYSGKTVNIRWKQHSTGLGSSDYMYYAFSGDGGLHWSADSEVFHGNIGSTPLTYSFSIPSQYVTSNFRLKLSYNFTSTSKYVYVNDIVITASNSTSIFYDDCATLASPPITWTSGGDWTAPSGRFTGHSNGSNHYLTMASSLNLSAYAGQMVTAYWTQSEDTNLEDSDRLYFSFSANGGSTWSSDIEAFRDDIIGSSQLWNYTIPTEYLTSDFKFRFKLNGFAESGENCYIDNIIIAPGYVCLQYPGNPTTQNLTTLVQENTRVNQAKFGSTVDNTMAITADRWQVVKTEDHGNGVFSGQWSYSCYKDVTDLVHGWIENEDITTNGLGTYTLGHVVAANQADPGYSVSFVPSGTTGYPLVTPAPGSSPANCYQASYAGWSLIFIYSNPDTRGHQLYLYDDLISAWHIDPDFDGDGQPGGSIGGFLVPDPEGDIAAHITAFVGEGDDWISPEYFIVNDTQLSNSASPAYNVWNSNSPGLAIPGVDIDTFDITWASHILLPEDTEADVNLPTIGENSDQFMLVYIILSFTSETTTGGTLGYLIR